MPAPGKFSMKWQSGPSGQLEIFSPPANVPGGVYQLKYTPPFRTTLRPPLQRCNLGADELAPVDQGLEQLFQTLNARNAPAAPGAPDLAGHVALGAAQPPA